MNFLATLVSFLAVAAATPVADMAARTPQVHCHIVPFLRCEGGIDQQIACQSEDWTCKANGVPPIMYNATCVAQCVCDIPCP
ncbi:hypothetical protein K438DRAFT_2015253 [Mycena galopus ATCC 62051]|nr:hypothetical protein K438DRAFT_2015253 [Mycena galopus ATCC 62051]